MFPKLKSKRCFWLSYFITSVSFFIGLRLYNLVINHQQVESLFDIGLLLVIIFSPVLLPLHAVAALFATLISGLLSGFEHAYGVAEAKWILMLIPVFIILWLVIYKILQFFSPGRKRESPIEESK